MTGYLVMGEIFGLNCLLISEYIHFFKTMPKAVFPSSPSTLVQMLTLMAMMEHFVIVQPIFAMTTRVRNILCHAFQ